VKTQSIISRVFRGSTIVVLISAIGASVSCMTTYDAYGRPVQSVDPAAATAGVVAAGVLGYALADDNKNHYNKHHHYYHKGPHYRPYPPPPPYYRPYYRY